MAKFLLTKFVRREKKMAKILQAVKKDDKIYQVFGVFRGFRAYIGCLGV